MIEAQLKPTRDRTVQIEFALEVLEQRKDWSEPVEFRAVELPDGRWELWFRAAKDKHE